MSGRPLTSACILAALLPASALAQAPAVQPAANQAFRSAAVMPRFVSRLKDLDLGPRYADGAALPQGPAWEALGDEQRDWLVYRLMNVEEPLPVWLEQVIGREDARYLRRSADGELELTAEGRALAVGYLSAPPRRPDRVAAVPGKDAPRERPADAALKLASDRTAGLSAPGASAVFFDGSAGRTAVHATVHAAAASTPPPVEASYKSAPKHSRPDVEVQQLDKKSREKIKKKIEEMPDEELESFEQQVAVLEQMLEEAKDWRTAAIVSLVAAVATSIGVCLTGGPLPAAMTLAAWAPPIMAIIAQQKKINRLRKKLGKDE